MRRTKQYKVLDDKKFGQKFLPVRDSLNEYLKVSGRTYFTDLPTTGFHVKTSLGNIYKMLAEPIATFKSTNAEVGAIKIY